MRYILEKVIKAVELLRHKTRELQETGDPRPTATTWMPKPALTYGKRQVITEGTGIDLRAEKEETTGVGRGMTMVDRKEGVFLSVWDKEMPAVLCD